MVWGSNLEVGFNPNRSIPAGAGEPNPWPYRSATFLDTGSLEHRRDNDNLNQVPIFELYPDTGALRPVFLWTNPFAPD